MATETCVATKSIVHSTAALDDATAEGNWGLLLLAYALKGETEKIADLITQRQCGNPAFTFVIDEEGNTPLHLACRGGHADTAMYLIENTAIRLNCRNRFKFVPVSNSSSTVEGDFTALHEAILKHERNNQKCGSGGGPLAMKKVVEQLMTRMSVRDLTESTFRTRWEGGCCLEETLLHFVAVHDVENGCPIVERLVLLGADPLLPAAPTTKHFPAAPSDNSPGKTFSSAYELAKRYSRPSFFFLNNYALNRAASLEGEDSEVDAAMTAEVLRKENPMWWAVGSQSISELIAASGL